jgi:hypothetical protein
MNSSSGNGTGRLPIEMKTRAIEVLSDVERLDKNRSGNKRVKNLYNALL